MASIGVWAMHKISLNYTKTHTGMQDVGVWFTFFNSAATLPEDRTGM